MKTIIKQDGQFVLQDEDGIAISSLGSTIDIVLRRIIHIPGHQHGVNGINYVVEITHAKNINLKELNIVMLRVPLGNDTRIAWTVFSNDAWGQPHRLGLHEYVVGDDHGWALTIGGLLWDGRILHVRDIVI